METRLEYLNKLTKYVSETEDNINILVNELGWSEKLKPDNKEKSCKLSKISNGSDEDREEMFPESCGESRYSIQFDHALQSYKDFVLNFTREERLAMYDYAIQQTGHYDQPETMFLFQPDNTEKPKRKMTLTEIMTLQKRRRSKYRISKNLPFSYTEEIRNLINDQMEVLHEHLRTESIAPETSRNVTTEERSDALASKDKRAHHSKHKKAKSQERDRSRHKKKHSKEHKRARSHSRKHSKRKSRSPNQRHRHKSRKQ